MTRGMFWPLAFCALICAAAFWFAWLVSDHLARECEARGGVLVGAYPVCIAASCIPGPPR